MKKIEIVKINIKLLILMLVGGYCLCSLLALIENLLTNISPVILIIVFCYVLYKTIIKEGRN